MILTIPITQAPTMAAGSFGQESALSFLAVCGISYVFTAELFLQKMSQKTSSRQHRRPAEPESNPHQPNVRFLNSKPFLPPKGAPTPPALPMETVIITPLKNRLLHKRACLPDRPLRLGVTSLPIRLKGLPSPGNISSSQSNDDFWDKFFDK